MFGKFITALGGADGFDTGAPVEISLATLGGLKQQLLDLNTNLSDRDAKLTTARQKRKVGYEGLRQKFQAVKNSVKGQYGLKGAEWESVRGIRW
ncbi:MAG: hypothetical protein ACI8UO_003310 [Verrucomicrobiales bacterium]